MTKGEKSRLFIIRKSAPIFNRLGYSSTSLATIMEATKFEKGGIYKHFKTKENLALEAFTYAYQLCYQKLLKPLASLSTGLEKIEGFIENFGDLPGELTGGCPIFNTGMDSGRLNLPLKKEAKKAYGLWISELSRFIDQAKQEGDFPKSISTPVTANFIMVALEGALGGARLSEQKDLLKHTKQELRLYIELKRQKSPIKKSSTLGSPKN